jgi:hypothetical protein
MEMKLHTLRVSGELVSAIAIPSVVATPDSASNAGTMGATATVGVLRRRSRLS